MRGPKFTLMKMAIFGAFWQTGLIWHVLHKICNYNIIFRKLDILPIKVIPISTCYTSGSGTIKISWVWPLHYIETHKDMQQNKRILKD